MINLYMAEREETINGKKIIYYNVDKEIFNKPIAVYDPKEETIAIFKPKGEEEDKQTIATLISHIESKEA